MKILECEQLSPEWFAARAKTPTASCMDKIITTKGVKSKSYSKYIYKLAGETILGTKEESYTSAAMQRGIELEPDAIALFEMAKDLEATSVGFCIKDDESCGCSPDSLIGDDSGLEVKCPEKIEIHTEYLDKGVLPTKYFQQVHSSMFVTGRNNWWFMSYYPKMPPLIINVEIDYKWCAKLGALLKDFNEDLSNKVSRLKSL